MAGEILFVSENRSDKLAEATFEIAALASEIAGKLGKSFAGLVLGGGEAASLADQLAARGVPEIVSVSHEGLSKYCADGFCEAIRQVLEQRKPHVVLFSASSMSVDVAPRLAAKYGTALVSSCNGFSFEGGNLLFRRPAFNGKLEMKVRLKGNPPYFVTVEPGAFKALPAAAKGRVTTLAVTIDTSAFLSRLLEVITPPKGAVDISKAPIVVAGGRGVGSKENFHFIFDLAQVLGAEVGASRPVVDSGWVEYERQVGQSGKNVSPKLYIACGISGAIQHLVGMRGAQTVVAINKDPEAPIFNVARYGVVGDLFEIIPPLIEEIKKVRTQ